VINAVFFKKRLGYQRHKACNCGSEAESILPIGGAVGMDARRKFLGTNFDILLILFRLLRVEYKWTFTKRFTISTP